MIISLAVDLKTGLVSVESADAVKIEASIAAAGYPPEFGKGA